MATTLQKTTTAREVLKQIEKGKISLQEIDNLYFFKEICPGKYSIIPETRLQIREQDVDHDFIERQVNKNTPHHLDSKYVIFFPSDVYDTDGTLFARGGDRKLVGGNHTVGIEIQLGILKSDAYVINFDTQLGGVISEALNLGNLLNNREKETRSTKKDDVRQIVIQKMLENDKKYGDATLRKDQEQAILEDYPFITKAMIGQWTSHNQKVGGRRKPLKKWTGPELDEAWKHYGNQEQYEDYIILEPRTVPSWHQTSISTLVSELVSDSNYKNGKPDKRKFLLIFYCSNQTQADDLAKTKTSMREKYNRLELLCNIQIKTEFLKSK